MTKISRRKFFNRSLIGAGSFIMASNSFGRSVVFKSDQFENPDVIIKLTAEKRTFKVSGNGPTTFWTYRGELIKGDSSHLIPNEDIYLGPTINLWKGQKVRIIFENGLTEKSIVHWHGLDVSHENDGHPHFAINSGKTYQYDFEVSNRAGMYWYHPHPHGRTGFQVYQGLAGLFIVRDNEERDLKLPEEKNIVIQDRAFKDNGELDYRPSMMGAFGDTLLINGSKNNTIKVKKGAYRLRLLNGCNARIFNLALSSKEPLVQIGSDGGLLPTPIKLDKSFFAPAERLDLIVDFSNYNAGTVLSLESLPLVPGRGEKYPILNFEIQEEEGESYTLPNTLSSFEKIPLDEANNLNNPKKFELIPKRGSGWTINGKPYEHNSFQDYELIPFGTTEVWEFYNPTGMPHPMHIHGTQFQIIDRKSGQLKGCLDHGWKDTVLVMPGDRVRVIKRFNTFKGIFIYHCHNLEHEDMSMMRNYKVI